MAVNIQIESGVGQRQFSRGSQTVVGIMLGCKMLGEKEFLMVKKSALRTRRTHNPVFKARVALAAVLEPSSH